MVNQKTEEQKKSEIIISVLENIAENGIDNLTIDSIAERAGCAHGLINYYFKKKDILIAEAFRYFLEYYNERIKEDIQEGMNEVDILRIIIKHAMPLKDEKILKKRGQFVLTYELKTNLFIQFFSKAQFNLRLEEIFVEIYNRQYEGMVKLIKSGIKRGLIKRVSAETAAYTLLALIIGYSNFRTLGFFPSELPNARQLCNEYLNSIIVNKEERKK